MTTSAASHAHAIRSLTQNISLRLRAEFNPLGYTLLHLWQCDGEDRYRGAQFQRHAAQRLLLPGTLLRRLAFNRPHPELHHVGRHARQVLEKVRPGDAVRSLQRMVRREDEWTVSMISR